MFKNSIVIVHERKFLMLFWLLNKIFFQNIKIVYIHHNMLFGHKLTTKLPEHIVAISDEGIKNLTEYFGVPRGHITKIYNCVRDIHPERHSVPSGREDYSPTSCQNQRREAASGDCQASEKQIET